MAINKPQMDGRLIAKGPHLWMRNTVGMEQEERFAAGVLFLWRIYNYHYYGLPYTHWLMRLDICGCEDILSQAGDSVFEYYFGDIVRQFHIQLKLYAILNTPHWLGKYAIMYFDIENSTILCNLIDHRVYIHPLRTFSNVCSGMYSYSNSTHFEYQLLRRMLHIWLRTPFRCYSIIADRINIQNLSQHGNWFAFAMTTLDFSSRMIILVS